MTADLLLDYFIDIEFDEVFHVFFVEGNELFFHGSWASDGTRSAWF